MAESILITIAEKVLEQIMSPFVQELVLACGLKAELKKLGNTLSHVKAVILDAEEQQLTSHEVCTWLGQLKNVLFDAEDVFDEFAYEALRKQLVNSRTHGGISKKVRHFLSTSSNPIAFRLRMSRKVKEIREAFDEISANKADFHLNTYHIAPTNSTTLSVQRELTHSFVHSSEIIGRDEDRDTILCSLMDSQSPNESVSVVSIGGIGGLGKTALAKMIFNDQRVVDSFEKKLWVCLGDLTEFNVNKVMAKVVECITGQESAQSNPEPLQTCIRNNLCDKRFLLVLDDVWDVGRANWLEFKDLLKCGANGSKVMVTTRNSNVASNMGSVLARSLKGLPPNECVSLFKKFAFGEGEDDGELMKIGKAIIEKCKGVPLAIRTLGCLLFSKRDRADWERVRDNGVWQLEQNKGDILPALKISYDMLPFILKQCFVSCSLFPKDHVFWNYKLIQNWEAIGLIRSSVKNIKVEDIGQQYIDALHVRGFFQDFVDFKTFSRFKMHDLIHDLALSVAKNELENMKGDRQGKDMYKSIRHVWFSRREGLGGEKFPNLFLTSNLRSSCVMPTFGSVFFDRVGGDIGELVETCISNLKHLRFIDLHGITNLERLPHSIGALKHLRDVNLKRCKRLKRLPDSVCKLYNLQSLNLYECIELEELPKDIGDLVNLKRLKVTTKQRRLSEGAGKGLESSTSLRSLTLGYCENLEYIFELATGETQQLLLTSIQALTIYWCDRLKCLFPPSPGMKKSRELSDLETLTIMGCPESDLASIFNDHISLVKLKKLSLMELPQMESLPEWINLKGCATTLECLRIDYCPNLTSLPEWLHNLTSLHRLEIWDCPELLCLPDGLHVLKELMIEGCPELSRRCKRGTGEDWPKIKHIPQIELDGEQQ